MRWKDYLLAAMVVLPILCGCLTVGRNFRTDNLAWIVTDKTDRKEVQQRLGEPFRTGLDSGTPTWTYGYYQYRLFGDTCTKDLVIYFNKDGTVSSYTFNTSFPQEKDRMMRKSGF